MDTLLGLLPMLDRVGAVTTVMFVAFLIITERLIWHKRFDKLQADRDKWQKIALDALMGPAQAGVRAAEVAVGVVSRIPDPEAERESAGRD